MKLKNRIKETYVDDPYESSAVAAFCIGLPFVLIVFIGILLLIRNG